MSLFIEIPPVRRGKLEARTVWRESAPRDLAEQIADYCDPERNYSRLLLRCRHGVYWADPEPVYDGEGEVVGWVPLASECAVCFPQRLHRRTLQFQRLTSNLQIAICHFGPNRLDKWPRKGSRRIQLKGYYDNDAEIYLPPDHYVSPYDERFRFREPEAMGGYIRSGKNDGVGIRARLGWGETADGGELRFHSKRSLRNEELDEENGLVFYSPQNVERPQSAVIACDFGKLPAPSARTTYFSDERNIAATRVVNGVILYRRIGCNSWTDRPPEKVVSEPGKKRRRLQEHETGLRFEDQHSGRGFAVGVCCGHCWLCQLVGVKSQTLPGDSSPVYLRPAINWTLPPKSPNELPQTTFEPRRTQSVTVWDHQRIGSRKSVWPEKWRTERPMRDLAARLKMYAYGSDGETVQVDRMMQTAWENLRQAQKNLLRYAAVPGRPAASETYPNYRTATAY